MYKMKEQNSFQTCEAQFWSKNDRFWSHFDKNHQTYPLHKTDPSPGDEAQQGYAYVPDGGRRKTVTD